MIFRAPMQALDIRRDIPDLTTGGIRVREERGRDGLAIPCCKAPAGGRVRALKLLASEIDQARQGDADGSCAIIVAGHGGRNTITE